MSAFAPAHAPTSITTVVEGLRAPSEVGDADVLEQLRAPDVVFHSPFTPN